MTSRWKKRLKRLWARRPRLSRGQKTVRNLLLLLLILVYWWGECGYPLFFPTLEFRRLERQNLLPRGEIVFSATPGLFSSSVELELNGETVTLRDTWRVGAGENWAAVMGYYRKYSNMKSFSCYPRGDGPDPIPLPSGYLLSYQRGQGFTSYLPLLFLDIPQGAVRAEVEMDIEETPCHRAGEGTNQGNGVWLFGLEPPEEGGWSDRWYDGASYTLQAYAQDGALLGLWTGTVPNEG